MPGEGLALPPVTVTIGNMTEVVGARLRARAARREELLGAVISAIRRHGPGVTMEEIAAEAGITKPILYRHFGDRDGLVLALADRFSADLLFELEQALDRDASPRTLIATTIDAYVRFVEHETPLYRFLTQWVGREHPQSVTGLMAAVAERVREVITARLVAAGLTTEPVDTWAYGLVGMVHVAADRWVEQRAKSREQLVAELTDLLWRGMAGIG